MTSRFRLVFTWIESDQFQHGKKILLLDDLQLLFWKEENEKPIPIDRELLRKLSEILHIGNPDFKVIATTSYSFKEVKSMLTFNEMVPPAIVEVGIKPLSFKKINEYARELRTYGYLIRNCGSAMMLLNAVISYRF